MPATNDNQGYGYVAIFLHWLIAGLVILMLTLGILLDSIPVAYQGWFYNLHKSCGILILFLAIIRLIWRLFNKIPQPAPASAWESALARFSHGAFYFLLIATPLAGWAMSSTYNHPPNIFWLASIYLPGIPIGNHQLGDILNNMHSFFAYSLLWIAVLHVIGALKHHFINKDRILLRILRSRK
jgi:cytochrome b561